MYLGIDGGGSTLRVALVDADLNVIRETTRGTANPSVIGREASAALIADAVREVTLNGTPHAVGIGVAGAAPSHSEAWLREVVANVLPGIYVTPASDIEIALVGAHGARRGSLVLAGTGSAALAIDDGGRSVMTGGWGYLIGDEGGGVWLGLNILRATTAWIDGCEPAAEHLARRVLTALNLTPDRALIGWTYRQPPPVREIAALTDILFAAADDGDTFANGIIERGADALALIVNTAARSLNLAPTPPAFAGGLLTTNTPLARALCRRFGLESPPQPRYPPVIGAALLARLLYPA